MGYLARTAVWLVLAIALLGCDASTSTDRATDNLERLVDEQSEQLDSQAEEIQRLEDRIAFLEADVRDLEDSVSERPPASEPERAIPAGWDGWSVIACDDFFEVVESRDRAGNFSEMFNDFFGVFYAGSQAEVDGISTATEQIRDGLRLDNPEAFESRLAELSRICSPLRQP